MLLQELAHADCIIARKCLCELLARIVFIECGGFHKSLSTIFLGLAIALALTMLKAIEQSRVLKPFLAVEPPLAKFHERVRFQRSLLQPNRSAPYALERGPCV